ncbi:MAG: hypothetical protein MI922_26655 [Bacteroidales bacterium]|nr:hypothetical protein [Bacteroidales bacterium]
MKQRFNKIYSLCLIVTLLSLLVPSSALAQMPIFEADVTNEETFTVIPSASGIANFNNHFYIIGDDSPFLFQLNSKYELINKIKISSTKELHNGRLPKKIKPDFESITIVPWGNDRDLLVFGSGGKEKQKIMVRIDFDDSKPNVVKYSLDKFYQHLVKESKGTGKLNIEGAGYWKNNLILLNRADNTLFKIDLDSFKKYLKDKDNDKPKVKPVKYTLPTNNGMPARFSGATILPDEDLLVFTASIENDPNWIVNESIIGSYLGVIDLNQLENDVPVCKEIMKNNTPIQEKVESVYVLSKTDTLIKVVGVIDNDNGSSKLIEIEFKKSPIRNKSE